MGFIIKYSRFFSITVSDAGTGQALEGFSFFPTMQCRRSLENYNLVFRQRSSGFEVFYAETPLVPISEKIRFSFGFRIPDTGLFKKYGLAKTNDTDPSVYQPGLYFDNLKSDGSIITDSPASIVAAGTDTTKTVSAADTYKIYPQTFNVFDSAGGTPPTSYALSPEYGTSATQTIPVEPKPGADYLVTLINSIDMKEHYLGESGPYLLQADTDPPPARNVYLNDELSRKSAQGVVDIYWENTQDSIADPEMGQQYQITFKPT